MISRVVFENAIVQWVPEIKEVHRKLPVVFFFFCARHQTDDESRSVV